MVADCWSEASFSVAAVVRLVVLRQTRDDSTLSVVCEWRRPVAFGHLKIGGGCSCHVEWEAGSSIGAGPSSGSQLHIDVFGPICLASRTAVGEDNVACPKLSTIIHWPCVFFHASVRSARPLACKLPSGQSHWAGCRITARRCSWPVGEDIQPRPTC